MNYKLTLMLLAILALLWRGYTSYSYYQVGRIGVSQDTNGVITKISHESPAVSAGLQTGDKIIDITGLAHPQDRPLIGQKLTYNISREGKEQLIEVIAAPFPNDLVIMMQTLAIMGLVFLICGMIAFFKLNNLKAFLFALYCIATAFHWGYIPNVIDFTLQNILTSFYVFVSICSGSFVLHFIWLFVNRPITTGKLLLFYLPGILGGIFLIITLVNSDMLPMFQLIEFVLVTLYVLAAYVFLIKKFINTPRSLRASFGLTIMVLGAVIGSLPYVLSEFFLFMDFGGNIGTQPYNLFFVLEPMAFAYGLIKAERAYNDKIAA